MKPRVMLPDIEALTVDLLASLIAPLETCTVGIGVPEGWKPTSEPHLQVELVATRRLFGDLHPVAGTAMVRIIARAATTTEAKRLAALGEGLLLTHAGGSGISTIKPLAGVLAERDPDTRAELASVTVRVTARTVPIPQGS